MQFPVTEKNNIREGCIYTISCPKTNLVRYVGKSFNFKNRCYQHLNPKKTEKSMNSQWLKGLKKNGLIPLISVIDSCNELNWEDKEKFYIKLYKSMGANLLNMTEGGESGAMNYKFTESQSLKLSKALKGKKKSESHIKNAKLALKEKFNTNIEYKDKMIKNALNALKELTPEQKEKARLKRNATYRKKLKLNFCDMHKVQKRIEAGEFNKTNAYKYLNLTHNKAAYLFKIYTK